MKIYILLIGIILSLPNQTFCQNNFLSIYDSDNYDDARKVIATEDGCYIFTGLNKSDQDILGDTYLMKVSSSGDIVWKKFYGLPLEDGGNDLIKCSDGGLLISGHINLGNDICDGYIIKTDANGVKEWDLLIGGPLDDVAQGVIEWSDGGFFVTGRYDNPITGNWDVMLSKISSNGDLEFTKGFEKTGLQEGYGIVKSNDDNLLISGFSHENGSKDILVLKIDIYGNIIWEYNMSLPLDETALGLISKEGGGCIFTGGSKGKKYKFGFIGELNSDGELVKFNKILDGIGESYTYDICTTTKGYSICGVLKETGDSLGYPLVVSLNHDLIAESFQTVRTLYESKATSMIHTENGDYILVGQAILNSNNSNILFTQIVPAPFSFIKGVNDDQKSTLFPNPFHNVTNLKLSGSNSQKTLTIINSVGQIMRRREFNSSEIIIYRDDLLSGIYTYSVRDIKGQKVASGKMVVL